MEDINWNAVLAVMAIALSFFLLVIFMARHGLLPNPFEQNENGFSGTISKGLPAGFSITYEGALHAPVVSINNDKGSRIVAITDTDTGPEILEKLPSDIHFELTMVNFGNVRIVINSKNNQVTYSRHPEGIKFIVKKDDTIIRQFGYRKTS